MASENVTDSNTARHAPMEVLCLGLSRSGTETLCRALTILGIPTYHGWRSIETEGQSRLWSQAVDAKYKNKGKPWEREDFDRILGKYNAVTDLPCAMFPVELIQSYPEAKVILNKRPFEPWWASWGRTMLVMKESLAFWFICQWDGESRSINNLWQDIIGFYFNQNPRRNARLVYDQHIALVRGAAPQDRFLEWEVTEGWAPLCKFLGRPIPDEEFPSGNVTEEFMKKTDDLMSVSLKRAMRNLAIVGTSTVALLAYGFVKRKSLFNSM